MSIESSINPSSLEAIRLDTQEDALTILKKAEKDYLRSGCTIHEFAQIPIEKLSVSEADELGRRMLAIDQRRSIPFLGNSSFGLTRRRMGDKSISGLDSNNVEIFQPAVDISTPLLITKEHAFDEPLISGWRATVSSIGSDFNEALYAIFRREDNRPRGRRVTGLRLDLVVQKPGDAASGVVAEDVLASENYPYPSIDQRTPDATPYEDLTGAYYMQQYKVLTVMRYGHLALRNSSDR